MFLCRKLPLPALALSLAAVQPGSALTPPASPVTGRTPQFENESVRVWRSSIAPHQPLTMHRHESGRVLVALTGGTVKITPPASGTRTSTRARSRSRSWSWS